MFRSLAVHVIPIVSVATGSVRLLRDRGLEGVDKGDPFGEKASWDTDTKYAKWHGIDVDALSDAMDSPEVQNIHFGPEWARLPTLTRHAAGKARAQKSPAGDAAARERRPRTDVDGAEISASAQSARWSTERLQHMPQTYESLVNSGALSRDSADEDIEDDDIPLPPSIDPSQPFQKQEPSATRSRTEANSAVLRTSVEDGLPETDPLAWTTADVVRFLRVYATIDDDMAQAFEMVRVDGDMLLNKVFPCSLFKEMRKWHNRGRTSPPNVSTDLVHETIYLCYPYGRS